MTETDAHPFGNYGFATQRTFQVKATGLTIARSWRRQSFQAGGSDVGLSKSVVGKACSETDDVHVIGRDDQRATEFALTIKSDVRAAEEWQGNQRLEELAIANDGSTPELRIRADIFDHLSTEPPTAILFVTESDSELGLRGGWSLECGVPPGVLNELEADLLAHRADELHLGLQWEGGLVGNSYAPPALPTSWGLITASKQNGPEPLRGYVKWISWRVQTGRLAVNLSPASIGASEKAPQREQNADEPRMALAHGISVLARWCAVGFLATFVLIIFGFVLR